MDFAYPHATSGHSFTSFYATNSKLTVNHVAHNLFTAPDLNPSEQWAFFIDDGDINLSATPSFEDPPPVKYWRGTAAYQSAGSFSWSYLNTCGDASCSTSNQIKSHLPVETTFDPISGNTIVARVDTAFSGGESNGDIWIHPGFQNAMPPRLRNGSKYSAVTPTESYSTFNYDWETDFPVGIACGTLGTYNCVLAFNDRGIPDGNILYTFFRVNPTNSTIQWSSSTKRLPNAVTASGVSAGAIDGEIWLAWKSQVAPNIRTARQGPSGIYLFSLADSFSASRVVVDSPTFHTHNVSTLLQSAALTWTED